MILTIGCVVVSVQADTAGYAVRAVLPDNQADDQVSYFDLKVTPGQRQTLRVVVINKADTEIEVAMEANTAYTNGNGSIGYSHTADRDASLEVDFAEIVTPVKPVIMVPAHGEAVAEFVLTVPNEPFEGNVLGGLLFTKLNQGADTEEAGVAIQNVYQYVIGVRLKESEAVVQPAFELIGAVENETRKQTILLHLRNPKPIIAREVKLVVNAYPQDGVEPIFSCECAPIAMAPNTTMAYNIRLGDDNRLSPGEYRVLVELHFEEETWCFEAPLSVF